MCFLFSNWNKHEETEEAFSKQSEKMGRSSLRTFVMVVVIVLTSLFAVVPTSMAQLRQDFYADVCPNVESIVRNAVTKKFRQTFVTVPATLRLFFHDCFVQVIEFIL